jgi:hypothetical protein
MYYGYDVLICASVGMVKLIEDELVKLDAEESLTLLNHLDDKIPEDKIEELFQIVKRIWKTCQTKLVKYKELYEASQTNVL